jgi:hypothetical protein
VKPNVPIYNFGHQTIQCPAASSHEVQDPGALLLGFQSAFNDVDLPRNASNTSQKLFSCVGHESTIL